MKKSIFVLHAALFLIPVLFCVFSVGLLPTASATLTQEYETSNYIVKDCTTDYVGYGDYIRNEDGYAVCRLTERVYPDPESDYSYESFLYTLLDANGQWIFTKEDGINNDISVNNGIISVVPPYTTAYGDKQGYYDLQGRKLFNYEYETLKAFSDGVAFIRTKNDAAKYPGKALLIDADGNVLLTLPSHFYDISSWGDGGNGYYTNMGWYSEGLISFGSDELYNGTIFNGSEGDTYTCGFMDLQGNVVIPQQFYSTSPFYDGYAVVESDNNEEAVIDKTGSFVVPYQQYDEITNFRNGLFCVKKDGKYGIINAERNVVVPLVYDDIYRGDDGVNMYFLDNHITLKTLDGEVIWESDKDSCTDCTGLINGYFYYISNDRIHIVSIEKKEKPLEIAVPQNVTAKASGDKQITVSYSASAGATQYNIYRYNGAEKIYKYKGTSYTTSYIDKNLYAGTAYYYKVVAVNKSNGNTLVSAKSATASAKAVAAPAAPTGVIVKPTADKTLTLSYKAVEGATQYNIYRYNSTKKDYVYKGTSYTTSWADKTVAGGVSYYYKVIAVIKNNNGTVVGPMSAAVSAKALATPAVPQNVTAKSSGDRQITISYKASAGATQYNIYRYNGNTKKYQYKGTTFATADIPTEYVDKNLSANITYYYKVVAVIKEAGLTLQSAQSAACNAKSIGTPAVPQNVTAKSSGDRQITISYKASAGATQYNIYRYNGNTKKYQYKGTTFATADIPTEYVDKNLSANITYYYKVVAVTKEAGLTLQSAQSSSANAKAIAAPVTPEAIAASGGTGKITVFWIMSEGATQYNVYRYNSTKKAYAYKGTSYTTNWSDTTVTAGTTYYYKVVAVKKEAGLTLVSAQSASANAKAK